jgi:hypothetical protein
MKHVGLAQAVGPPPWGLAVLTGVVFIAAVALTLSTAGWAVVGLVGLTLVLAAGALASLWQWRRERAEAEGAAACQPGCAGPLPAVAYDGLQDSGHIFTFANLEYADAFAEANGVTIDRPDESHAPGAGRLPDRVWEGHAGGQRRGYSND